MSRVRASRPRSLTKIAGVVVVNVHALADHIAINLGALVMMRSKYFRQGIESDPFTRHLAAVRMEPPELPGEGDYELLASTLAGDLSAAFRVAQWRGNDVPTVIYHHGMGASPSTPHSSGSSRTGNRRYLQT